MDVMYWVLLPDLCTALISVCIVYTPYLKSVKLAVEVDGEQKDVEDYSDHIKDAELGDHGPEWDFETQVKFIDHDQRQNVTWAI